MASHVWIYRAAGCWTQNTMKRRPCWSVYQTMHPIFLVCIMFNWLIIKPCHQLISVRAGKITYITTSLKKRHTWSRVTCDSRLLDTCMHSLFTQYATNHTWLATTCVFSLEVLCGLPARTVTGGMVFIIVVEHYANEENVLKNPQVSVFITINSTWRKSWSLPSNPQNAKLNLPPMDVL